MDAVSAMLDFQVGQEWTLQLFKYNGRLDGEAPAEIGSGGAAEIARISAPVEVEIDISSLLPA